MSLDRPDSRGEQGDELAIQVNVLQRRVSEIVFLRQPAEHVRLSLKRRQRSGLALPQQYRRVGRRQLLGRNHLVEQRLNRPILDYALTHDWYGYTVT